METEIKEKFEQLMVHYSQGVFQEVFLQAKEQFIALTGSLYEEREALDHRLNSFYEWYFFNYAKSKIFKDYQMGDDFFETFHYSFFEYAGKSFTKKELFVDYLNKEKLSFSPGPKLFGMEKGDLMIGRFVKVQKSYHLFPGFFILPTSVKRILKRDAKKISRLRDEDKNGEFLLKLEGLFNKWRRLGYPDSSKIFVYGA
jgi:hypothetical protein